MYNDTNNPQQAEAKRIIRKALRNGFSVSVSDGDGGWFCERSRDYDTVLAAVGEMDMDELFFFDDAAGKSVGWMMLIWEAGGYASELAADYTDNPAMNALAYNA
jgi:hypothetical protein